MIEKALRMSPADRQLKRDDEMKQIARAAASEVVSTAHAAAGLLAATAAQAAQALSESTRIDLGYIKKELEEIKIRLDNKFVSVEAFAPIKAVVYGLVAIILSGVIMGVIALVLRVKQ